MLGQPENHYLYLAVTIGIIGLCAFLAIIVVFFYIGFRLLRRFPGRGVIYLASAFIAAVAQYCIYMLFNPTAILPELVFWLSLALTSALAGMEMPGRDGSVAPVNKRLGIREKADPGRLRQAISVLIVIIFTGIGFGLTLSPALADMKLSNATRVWSSDTHETMSALAEAVNLEPGEAVYYGHIGSYAFKRASTSKDAAEKSKLLALSTAAYGAAGKREPYLAYWSYTTGDVYTYRANHDDPDKWTDALRYYKRADILMPGNAVILNKWALALMLKGDYAEAGRKLSESRSADGEWVPTTYYTGLLDIYEHCYCTAGYCFVSPVERKIENVGPYISFCSQLALYGDPGKVVDGLKIYDGCHPGDWIGQALLGIAEVYDNKLAAAEDSFRRSAGNVPPEHAGMLKTIVDIMGMENRGFQPVAQDIADSLIEKIPGTTR